MRLTVHTDLALRTLIDVALADGARTTVADVAERQAVSRHHLMKVVQRLGAHGYLVNTRGRNGGLSLARPPEAIRIGDVVRHLEDDLSLAECFRSDGRCRLTPGCVLAGALAEALDAFLGVLDGYTLADLVADRASLKRLLALDAPQHRDTRLASSKT